MVKWSKEKKFKLKEEKTFKKKNYTYLKARIHKNIRK
jgi:hypothetical protein